MSFNRGFLKDRITVLNRTASTDGAFGRTGGQFQPEREIWSNVSFSKGKKALAEGAVDAYDYYMVRTDCHSFLREESRLRFKGHDYQIESFNADESVNECQILCVRIQK